MTVFRLRRHVPLAKVDGEILWQQAMAFAIDPCHTQGTGLEALGDYEEVNHAYACDRCRGPDP